MVILIAWILGLIFGLIIAFKTDFDYFISASLYGISAFTSIFLIISCCCLLWSPNTPIFKQEQSLYCIDQRSQIFLYEEQPQSGQKTYYVYFTKDGKRVFRQRVRTANSYIHIESNKEPKVIKSVYDIKNLFLKYITFKSMRQKVEYDFYIPPTDSVQLIKYTNAN